MSAVIFALLLVATALGLERYSTVHSLDDVRRGGWKWRIILWKPGSPP